MRLLAAALLVVSTASVARASEQRFERTVPLRPDTPIRVEATIADVIIEGAARSDLSVQVIRRAPAAGDFDKYPIVFDDSNGVRISAVQADGAVDPNLKTEIRLSLPSAAILDTLSVFEGHVKVSNLRGACNVSIRRGDIDATGLAGRVRLQTELGAIDVRQAELTSGGMMHLRTFNGDVRVHFSRRPADARILAVTYNGGITSDIPLAMQDKFGPHFGETTLGRGEPVLSIDIVKGNVAIKVG